MFIIKQLRRKKNILQGELADAIGVSLRTIQLYERLEANIPIKNLKKIAAYFGMTIAELYSLERVGEIDMHYDNHKNAHEKAHNITKLGPGKYLLTVPLVLSEEQKSYLEKWDNPAFMKRLPRMAFVIDQVSVAHYTAFEITNDSMDDKSKNGIPDKTIVLGKQVASNKIFAQVQEYPDAIWVLIHRRGIMCKKISSYSKKEQRVVCHSLNPSPEYVDFELPLDEIIQLFRVIKKQVD